MAPQLGGLRPIHAPILAAPGNDWKQAAAGGIHAIAIKQDGTLWGWGNNWAGSVGIASPTGSSTPVQIGSATNWIKVWAWRPGKRGGCKPMAASITGARTPTRLSTRGRANSRFPCASARTPTGWTWGLASNTVFAIKSDGTLWAWGRHAEAFTGARDPLQNVIPMRVGTDSDWRSLSASTGWWGQGLIKQDGSLWLMDASDGQANGPRAPYKPVQFRRVGLQREYVAYAGGAAHAAAPGVHRLLAVVLTPEGEVWTCGLVLGDPRSVWSRLLESFVTIAQRLQVKVSAPDPLAVYREKPVAACRCRAGPGDQVALSERICGPEGLSLFQVRYTEMRFYAFS